MKRCSIINFFGNNNQVMFICCRGVIKEIPVDKRCHLALLRLGLYGIALAYEIKSRWVLCMQEVQACVEAVKYEEEVNHHDRRSCRRR